MGDVRVAAADLFERKFRPVVLYPAGVRRQGRDDLTVGKEPFGREWGIKPLDLATLERDIAHFTSRGGTPGLGLCLGPGRAPDGGWLSDIEGDGPGAALSLATLLGGELIASMGWLSARGGHLLLSLDAVRMARLLPHLKGFETRDKASPGVFKFPTLPGLELRIGGFKADGVTVKQLHSACPPTPGTTGKPREWNGVDVVAPAPESFYAFLEHVARVAESRANPSEPGRPRVNSSELGVNHGDRYAKAAFDKELAKLAGASEGNRNDQLNRSSFAMGQLVGAGALDEHEVRRALADVAGRLGLGGSEISATVGSGIESGKAGPRDLSGINRNGRPSMNGNGHAAKIVPEVRAPAMKEERTPIECTLLYDDILVQTIVALRAHPDLYVKGPVLVEVVPEDQEERKLTRKTLLKGLLGAPRVHVLDASVIRTFLTRVIDFFRWEPGEKGSTEDKAVSMAPPGWLVDAVTHRKHWSGLRVLLAVAECPYPRADGVIVDVPGYDETTGILYRPSIDVPPGPANPTKADAEEAAARVLAHFKDFPFASPNDRAAFLADAMTAISRPGIDGPVPGFALLGNKAGTGKGLLVDCVGIIATGRVVASTTYPDDKEEANKVVVTLALEGACLVHFDNLENGTAYGSGPIDSMLTARTVKGRILGLSQSSGEIFLRLAPHLSGNNLSPGHDSYRRWIPINLVTHEEFPEERTDIEEKDFRNYLLEHRGSILRDLLTIFRAHIAAGRPSGPWGLMGSFENWDVVVRGAVYFAMGIDPNKTLKAAATDSPKRLDHLALLEAYQSVPGGSHMESGVTVATAMKLATPDRDGVSKLPLFWDVVLRFGKDGRPASNESIGRRILSLKNNPVGGMYFEQVGIDHQAKLWRVGKSPGGEDGEDKGGYRTPLRKLKDSVTTSSHSYRKEENSIRGTTSSHNLPILPEREPGCDDDLGDCLDDTNGEQHAN